MLFNELPIIFPWYEKIEQQNRYNENVEPVCDYKLVTPMDALLPFQFAKPPAGLLPTLWEIYDVNSNNLVADLTPSIPFLYVRKLEGKEYFYYDGRKLKTPFNADLAMAPGYYYSRMVFPSSIMFFSEMFYVPLDGAFNIADDDNIPFIRMEWWNDGDLRPIFYNHIEPGQSKPVFRNVVYLDSFITASEPEITEDGTRDGDDELIPTFQKAVIPYRITIATPDFLKKALMIMQLHEHFLIATKFGVRSGEIRKLTVQSALEASGGLSIVDILFQQDLAMVKKNCADNMNSDCGVNPPTIAITFSGTPGYYHIVGTAPANTTIELWGSVTVSAPLQKIGTTVYGQAQFVTGFDIPINDLTAYTYISARAQGFGCDFGFAVSVAKP